jgi:metal-responsive CopG/Arc/MetJ family transcriptional regulator
VLANWNMGAMNTTKVSLSLPGKLARQAERAAKREGRTRSELLREALKLYLAESKWRELRKYGTAQAGKMGLAEEDVERLIREYRAGH